MKVLLRITFLLLATGTAARSSHQDDAERLVQELIKQLDADDVAVRDAAAGKLYELGATAVPELEKVARSTRVEVATRAQGLLHMIALRGKLTPNLVKCLPGIERRLAGAPEHEWTLVFTELLPLGRTDHWNDLDKKGLEQADLEALVPTALRGALPSELASVCRGVLLYRLKKARAELVRILGERGNEVPPTLISALSYVHAREASPMLITLLKSDNAELRGASAYVLSQLGVKDAIPELRRLLKDQNTSSKHVATRALRFLDAREAVPDLLPLLKDEDLEVRTQAAYTLETFGAKEAISGIREMLKNDQTRVIAAYALQSLGAREATPDLIPLLNDQHFRGCAAEILGELGSKESIPELLKVLKVPDYICNTMAMRALGKLGAKEAIPEMLRLLKAPDATGKEYATVALGDVGSEEPLPELRKCVRNSDPATRAAALQAIGAILKDKASEELRNYLTDPDPAVRQALAYTLGRYDPRGSKQEILALLKDGAAQVRLAAVGVARDWGFEGGKETALGLLQAATGEDRLRAAAELCLMGYLKGAPVLIEQRRGSESRIRSLFALNGLRHPGLAHHIRNVDVVGFRGNRNGRIAETLAKLLGLKLDDSELTPYERESLETSGGSYKQQTLLEAIQQITNWSAVEVVVETDRIRLLPRAEAVRYWEEWLKAQ